MQTNEYSIQFFSPFPMTNCVASPCAVIMDPEGFLELTNFVDFARLVSFS